MAEPADLTQLDLQNLSPEDAAALVRAHQAQLAAQQHHALFGMLSAMPELQKAAAAEYGQAGKEREAGQQTAANVFRTALGQKEAEARLQELKLQGAQFHELLQQHAIENLRQDYASYLSGLKTVPSELVAREGKAGGEVAHIEAVTNEASKLPIIGGLAPTIGKILGAGKKAELASTEKEKEKGGYRTEAPLSFEEFARMRLTGKGPPKRAAPATATPAPQPAAPPVAPTHYRYNQDRSMRIPTDAAGNQLGPPEPNR